jgi:glycosyltransferase involved in cell wall biosynthesis
MKTRVPLASLDASEPIVPPHEPGSTVHNAPPPTRLEVGTGIRHWISRHGRRVKIAIFTSHPIQYQAPWFAALAQREGLDLKVFFSYEPDAAAQGIGFGQSLNWDVPLRDGYDSEVLSGDGAGSARFPRGLMRARAALRTFRPDVALVLGWHHGSLVQALLACKIMGIPVILRGESNAKRQRPWWVSLVHAGYVRMADAVLAIGDANAEFFRLAGADEAKIFMARYCVDNGRFLSAAQQHQSDRQTFRSRWGIAPDRFCAAFFGKLEPKKRPMDFLRAIDAAARQGTPIHGLVVGTGSEMTDVQAFAAANALPVTFAGFLNQSEIAKAYVAADALVLPSDFGETWGLVCNEAMACGTPAIVSERVGCANDLVLNGQTGAVVSFASPDAIARVLAAWSSDPDGYEAIRRQAMDHVLQHYAIEGAVEGLEKAIEGVLTH